MVQIYFLLILVNIIMGVILAKDFLSSKSENFSQVNELLSSDIVQVTIGCIGIVVGLLALFLRYSGNMVIIGDLIPAVVAIISGITLFIEYIANEESSDSAPIKFFERFFLKNRTILGIICMAVALVHFIAPSIELF